MWCPKCCNKMIVVDNGGGDPCWTCPACRCVMAYDRGDEDPLYDGRDDWPEGAGSGGAQVRTDMGKAAIA